MENLEEDYDENMDTFSIEDSVDIEYMKEMFKYEAIARKETDAINLSVEEENMIVCKIKEDLLNQAREEMHSELERYQISTYRTDTTAPDYDERMDPIIRKGLYEIKRLDKILLRKMQREKEVKRERILLQKKLGEELKEIEDRNKMLPKEIKNKVEQFLAIKPPIRHNEGMNANTAEDDYPKLFQTEVNHESVRSSNRGGESLQSGKSDSSTIGRENKSQKSNTSKTSKLNNSRISKLENERKKNFVKRNIELASKAAEPVVFTKEEEERLQYLLSDLNDDDSLMAAVDDNYVKSLTNKIEANPFQVATLDQYSNNYQLDRGDDGSLTALSLDSDLTSVKHQLSIESRLKHCMGEDRYKQLSRMDDKCSFPESVLYQTPLSFGDDMEMDCLGDKTLKELKYTRENQERLKEIDNLLADLSDGYQEEKLWLDPTVLRDLIKSSRENLSVTNFSDYSDLDSEKDHHGFSGSEMDLEPLSRDVLDSLLREAKLSNKQSDRLELISEITEVSEHDSWENPDSDKESVSRCDSSSFSAERPSSRFPDIRLYKHLTSPVPKR